MNIMYFLIVLGMFIYTVGYSIVLWKDRNKIGSIAVFSLACMVAVLPFFTLFK